ncbi:MAG: ABC transporter permease [Christensenellales bacterium]
MKIKRHFTTYGFTYALFGGTLFMLSIAQFNVSAASIFSVSLRQAGVLGVLTLGLCFVVLIGEMDFSCGALLSLGGGLCAGLVLEYHLPLWAGIALSVVVCSICGLLNGILVVKLKLHSSIVTLATMMLFSGGNLFISQFIGAVVLPPAFAAFMSFGSSKFLGIPNIAWIWLILFAIVALILRYTYYGRYFYGIGNSRSAMETMAINVPKYRIAAYTLSGMFAGIAGILMLSRIGISRSEANISFVFDGMIALTLGGFSLRGGKGNVTGVMLGIIIITLITICMTANGLYDYAQSVIKVLIFIVAVSVDKAIELKQQRIYFDR